MPTPVRVTAFTIIGMALLAACAPAPTNVQTATRVSVTPAPASVQTPTSLPSTPVPTSVVTPSGPPATRTPEPSSSGTNLVSGAVKSARIFSGRVGTTVVVTLDFSASSAAGAVREMRVKESLAPNGWLSGQTQCYSEAQLSQVAWEPFVAHKSYALTLPPIPTNTPYDPYNLGFAFYAVSVQFRDSAGNVSAVYCANDMIGKLP